MSLKDDILNVFTADMTDAIFCSQLASIIASYANSLTLTVTPSTITGADTTPVGTFTGAATVKWQIASAPIQSALQAVCTSSMTNDQLAAAFAQGLDAAVPIWTASLSGSTTTTSSPPVTAPATDTATITCVLDSSIVDSGLKSCFNSMNNMSENGDEYFATQLANYIKTYYTSAQVSGLGATHLAACTFTVAVNE